MNITVTVNSVLAIIQSYQDFLKGIDEDEFQKTPAEGYWSYSEVYSHVIRTNLSCMLAIEKCFHNKPVNSGSISFAGRLVLFFGTFPPVKLKAPANIAALVTKISCETAANDLIKLKHKLQELTPKIFKCPDSSKLRHPRFGMLNACQWLRFIEVHSRHHLKQLKRIEKMMDNRKFS